MTQPTCPRHALGTGRALHTGGAETEGLVRDELVAREAVVKLDHIDIAGLDAWHRGVSKTSP